VVQLPNQPLQSRGRHHGFPRCEVCAAGPAAELVRGDEGVGPMKRLHIQIQSARSPGLDVDMAVARLQILSAAVVSRGVDDGPYINVDYRPADVRALWAAVREQVRADPALASSAIVCCEGERGWDDYLLLHHYDPAERLDDVA
jgi:hypothetical protein